MAHAISDPRSATTTTKSTTFTSAAQCSIMRAANSMFCRVKQSPLHFEQVGGRPAMNHTLQRPQLNPQLPSPSCLCKLGCLLMMRRRTRMTCQASDQDESFAFFQVADRGPPSSLGHFLFEVLNRCALQALCQLELEFAEIRSS